MSETSTSKSHSGLRPEVYIQKEMQLYCEVIEDCITTTRKRLLNAFALFRLQVQICQDLGNVQATISLNKQNIKNLLSEVEGNKDNLKPEKLDELKFYEMYHSMYKALENAFKTVMDGLIWRIFSFNRALIYTLSEPDQSSGHLQIGKPSFEEELSAFTSTYNEQKGIAILNDTTNVVRFGDIIKFSSQGEWEIEEIKRGKPRSKAKIRAERQKEKLEELITFIYTGTRKRENETRIIEIYETPVVHYLKDLEIMLGDLNTVPVISKKLAAHIIVEVCDPYKLHQIPESVINKDLERLLSSWKDDEVVPLDNLRKAGVFMRGCAPYSIYPFDESTCAKLITGQIFYRAWINLDELKRFFLNNGWLVEQDIIQSLKAKTSNGDVTQQKEEIRRTPIFTIKKGSFYTTIPPLFLTRMAFELLAPETILNMAEDMMKRGPSNQDDCEILLDLVNERSIWK